MPHSIVEFYISTITGQVAGNPVWFVICLSGQVGLETFPGINFEGRNYDIK